MSKTNKTHLVLYCRIGSKRILPYNRKFFSRIDWLVDEIDHTSSDTGIVACIKSRVDLEMLHAQLLEHGADTPRESSVVLIDLKSGNAKGNLNKINPKELDQDALFKFDPLVGSKKNLLNADKNEIELPNEDKVNEILERINEKGIDQLLPKDKALLDRYSAHLNKSK